MDKILWCDHSNETTLAVLLDDTIHFSIFCKIEFRIFLEFLKFLQVKGLLEGVQGNVAPFDNPTDHILSF